MCLTISPWRPYKRLRFSGVRIVTLAEGEVGELHVGLKGTMNAVFLKDLAQKTWRGLEACARQGKSGGDLCYGYDLVRAFAPDGTFTPGLRRINTEEAAVVRRIFTECVAGKSPRAVAQALNKEGIAGPQGRTWGPSTIYGNWRRGTGFLNNELYAGRLI
ncbi:MAG: recombinase family protein [Alphaproteobacteria bacterium]|nr:recombinase family protein [Alphaproteobacteria bacterium]